MKHHVVFLRLLKYYQPQSVCTTISIYWILNIFFNLNILFINYRLICQTSIGWKLLQVLGGSYRCWWPTKISIYLILFDREVITVIGKIAFSLYDLFTDNRDKILQLDMIGKHWLFRLPKNNHNTCTHVVDIVSCILT